MQQVVLNGCSSNWVDVTSGVPQGSVLGLLLFILYVNDITDTIQSATQMFADDTKLYRVIKQPSDSCTLQQDLNRIISWSKKWLLNFNPLKCKVMHLGRGNPTVYSMTDHTSGEVFELSLVEEEKDLGIWVTSNLKPSLHCIRTATRATQMLGQLKRLFKFLTKSSF